MAKVVIVIEDDKVTHIDGYGTTVVVLDKDMNKTVRMEFANDKKGDFYDNYKDIGYSELVSSKKNN